MYVLVDFLFFGGGGLMTTCISSSYSFKTLQKIRGKTFGFLVVGFFLFFNQLNQEVKVEEEFHLTEHLGSFAGWGRRIYGFSHVFDMNR